MYGLSINFIFEEAFPPISELSSTTFSASPSAEITHLPPFPSDIRKLSVELITVTFSAASSAAPLDNFTVPFSGFGAVAVYSLAVLSTNDAPTVTSDAGIEKVKVLSDTFVTLTSGSVVTSDALNPLFGLVVTVIFVPAFADRIPLEYVTLFIPIFDPFAQA